MYGYGFFFSFCAYSALVSLCIFTQSVALGCIPIGTSPRLCSNITSQIICSFAPSLLKYNLPIICKFAPPLLKCILPIICSFAPSLLVTSATQYLWLYFYRGFAPQFYVSPTAIQYSDGGIICYRVHCITTSTCYCILARTGWKPKKNLAQSNALGIVDYLFCALKEQKEGFWCNGRTVTRRFASFAFFVVKWNCRWKNI